MEPKEITEPAGAESHKICANSHNSGAGAQPGEVPRDHDWQLRAETAETKLATLTRQLAQLKEALQAAFDYLPKEYYGGDPDGDDTLQALNRKLAAALRQIEESRG